MAYFCRTVAILCIMMVVVLYVANCSIMVFCILLQKDLGKLWFLPPSDTCVCVRHCVSWFISSRVWFPSFGKWGLFYLSALVRHNDAVFNALGLLAKYVQFSWAFWLFKDCKIWERKLRIANAHDINLKALPSSSSLLSREGSLNDATAMISCCTCFADGHVTSVTQPDFAVGSCLCFMELSWARHKLEYG